MLLCKDGGTPAILDEVLERLLKRKDERKETIAATIFFAGRVFKSEEDLKFLDVNRVIGRKERRMSPYSSRTSRMYLNASWRKQKRRSRMRRR